MQKTPFQLKTTRTHFNDSSDIILGKKNYYNKCINTYI